MSAAYSAIVWSLENLPEPATFKMALRPTPPGRHITHAAARPPRGTTAIRQVHIVVDVCQQRVAQRGEDTGFIGAEMSENIKSKALRVSGSCS